MRNDTNAHGFVPEILVQGQRLSIALRLSSSSTAAIPTSTMWEAMPPATRSGCTSCNQDRSVSYWWRSKKPCPRVAVSRETDMVSRSILVHGPACTKRVSMCVLICGLPPRVATACAIHSIHWFQAGVSSPRVGKPGSSQTTVPLVHRRDAVR